MHERDVEEHQNGVGSLLVFVVGLKSAVEKAGKGSHRVVIQSSEGMKASYFFVFFVYFL